jgi:hypothetical protein
MRLLITFFIMFCQATFAYASDLTVHIQTQDTVCNYAVNHAQNALALAVQSDLVGVRIDAQVTACDPDDWRCTPYQHIFILMSKASGEYSVPESQYLSDRAQKLVGIFQAKATNDLTTTGATVTVGTDNQADKSGVAHMITDRAYVGLNDFSEFKDLDAQLPAFKVPAYKLLMNKLTRQH